MSRLRVQRLLARAAARAKARLERRRLERWAEAADRVPAKDGDSGVSGLLDHAGGRYLAERDDRTIEAST